MKSERGHSHGSSGTPCSARWNELTEVALTAHVVVPYDQCSPQLLTNLAKHLHDTFEIEHTTIQLQPPDSRRVLWRQRTGFDARSSVSALPTRGGRCDAALRGAGSAVGLRSTT